MAKEYTIAEFAELCGDIANGKVDKLCTNVVKAVGHTFLNYAVKETPKGSESYEFPTKWQGQGYKKSSTGLKKGWEDNRQFKVSKGAKVYTTVLANKAKSSYVSGYTKKRRTDYYAHYVDEGFIVKGGYKPFLDERLRPATFRGHKFTDRAINSTDAKIDSIAMKQLDKWLNEVF